LALPLSLGISALSGPVTRLLYGHAYAAVIPVLAILGFFCSAKAMAIPAQQLMVAMDRQDLVIKFMVTAGVLNIALDFWLIPRYGALGAAIANSAAQTFAAAIIWWGACQLASINFPGANLAKLLFVTIGMAFITAALAFKLPTIPAAVCGTVTGAFVFFLLLRLARVLNSTDSERLLSLESQMPNGLRCIYRRGITFVCVA
jgi:O-antigen/teichoic acid export membrane protein